MASLPTARTPSAATAADFEAPPASTSPSRSTAPIGRAPTPDETLPQDALTGLDETKAALAAGREPHIAGSLALVDEGRRRRWMYVREALPAGGYALVVQPVIPSLPAITAAPPADRFPSVSSHVEPVVMLDPSMLRATCSR